MNHVPNAGSLQPDYSSIQYRYVKFGNGLTEILNNEKGHGKRINSIIHVEYQIRGRCIRIIHIG